jgi:hypothetical protein
MCPPPAYVQLAQAEKPPETPAETQPETREVTPLDVSRYLPPTALVATIIVTVTPPSGTVLIYTPGYESSPVVFRGPKTVGEIRIAGPTVYIELLEGATGYSVQYLSWREP